MAKILCVDDEAALRDVLVQVLARAGHEPVAVEGVREAVLRLGTSRFDLVITDWAMPGLTGMDLLELMRDEGHEIPLVMLTAYGSIEHAVAAIRGGAANYLTKPFSSEQLHLAIEQALEVAQLRAQNAALLRESAERRHAHEIVGASEPMRRLLEHVAAAARSRATVLLQGESGTGKELLARAIHEQSERSRGPFVRINCAALPEGLVESTLFGHERGAFTGAFKRTPGVFERADGGTLLLDEIGEMRLDLQAKLLRVIQEREFERVGGTHPIRVDVRIIGTTNRDLSDEVRRGRFRQDLFYRLTVFPLVVPPLRNRRDDVAALAFRFASRAAAEGARPFDGFSPEALELLVQHDWPGNVRELQHAVERAVILSRDPVLGSHLFAGLRTGDPQRGPDAARPPVTDPTAHGVTVPTLQLADAERHIIEEALRVSGGNRTKAAALLGIDLRTLRRKLNAPSGAATARGEPSPDTLAG